MKRGDLLALPAAERRPALLAFLGERIASLVGLGAARPAPGQPLTALGLDSLAAVELTGVVAEALGAELALADLLEGGTTAEIADRILAGLGEDGALDALDANDANVPAAEIPSVRPGAAAAAGDHPLTVGQRALLLLERLAAGDGTYNIAVAARAGAGFDAAALSRALGRLTVRHAALRTTFPEFSGEGVQRIAERGTVDLLEVDAAGWSERQLGERLAADAYGPFDLTAGPLLRLRLFNSTDTTTLLLAVHHLVADFGSLAVLGRELGLLYREEAGGLVAALPPTGAEYVDFVRWQGEMLAGPHGGRLLAYWRDRLAGLPPALDLPTDRPRPPLQTHRGGAQADALPRALAERLQALSAAHGTTLFVTLLAAWQAQLARYSGQLDFAVGSPFVGRRTPALSAVLGYFVHPVVLRAALAGDPTFAGLLAATRSVVLGALEHGDYPFPLLVERLRPERDLARPPLFQVMFVLETGRPGEDPGLPAWALGEAGARFDLAGRALHSVRIEERRAQFELGLRLAPRAPAGGLGAVLEYNSDLFDAASAARIVAHFATLLSALADAPGAPLSTLPLLAPGERHQVLHEWRSGPAVAPGGSVIAAFEAQATRRPETGALVCSGRVLSYGELNRRAHRLARHLRALGVGPEVRVGLCLERSVELIVGLLAILKAGGAYVPLDPSYPAERLAFMLEDCGATVLLTESLLPGTGGEPGGRAAIAAVAAVAAVKVVVVEVGAAAGAISRRGEDLESGPEPGDLAYLIYTSGTTGRPKAVLVEHRQLANTLAAAREDFGFGPDLRMPVVAPSSFDIFLFELLSPLLAGGTAVVLPLRPALDFDLLLAELRWATSFHAVPAVLRQVLARLRERGLELPGLTAVFVGGDTVPAALLADLARQLPAARVRILYGPTEGALFCSSHAVAPGAMGAPGAMVPLLGRPIANVTLALNDREGRPAPVGVAGEVHIGGAAVTRGYLGRPDLTAERYVPGPGGRLYRTGDLARYRPDGTLEFLGRADRQVKVRGFRLELAEVEAILASHPGVREAVALVREDEPGDQRLVAYVVPESPEPGAEIALSALEASLSALLQALLQAKLPEALRPSALVVLAALPLTANGKVDRRRLPRPDGGRSGRAAGYVAPRSALERAIAAIWRRVLKVDAVGIHDRFFDLGGHSLLLAEVHGHFRAELGRELPIVDLFKHPTIAALARHLSPEGALGSVEGGPSARPVRARRETRGDADPAVAIIGMVGRFPGAADVAELWRRVRDAEECITFFSDAELAAAGVAPARLADPAYVRAGGVLAGAERFDAAFFGFSPREAEVMDPQHRVFLECAWEALEDAGYDPARFPGRIGVYAGVGFSTYLRRAEVGLLGSLAGQYQALIGNDKDFVPTRVSYQLNLRGPSVNVQTACSSSLVAIHLARQALLAGDCDLALAGGVSIRTAQREGYLYEAGGIPSPDGHCRAFDADAQGTVSGNGVGIVVLKRLADAVADRDAIRARVFTTLAHLIDVELLREAFGELRRDAASGVDGQSAAEYAEDLDVRLGDLHERQRRQQYRATPGRRVWISKEDGSPRPLSIPILEDKIVQKAVALLLTPLYEQDFYEFSYGFRPERGAHDALHALREQCM